MDLHINHISHLQSISKALSVDLRLKIYEMLQNQEMNINEIASQLEVPISTVSVNVKKLEEADLVESMVYPAEKGGSQKVCRCKYHKIVIDLQEKNSDTKSDPQAPPIHETSVNLPIGHFSRFEVSDPCGLASFEKVIGKFDHIPSFFMPERINAQILWFTEGFIEYNFPNEMPNGVKIESIEFSAEICSEAKGFAEKYPSEITLWIDDHEISTWLSPGDFGGKRGQFTPKWWKINSTQYGIWVQWKISPDHIITDGVRLDKRILSDLSFSSPFIKIRMGIKPDAKYKGGMNLFGKQFGNFNRDLQLIIRYSQDS